MYCLFILMQMMISNAEKVLISRATQCSFSSIYHLSKAGMNKNDYNNIKKLFQLTILTPSIFFGSIVIYNYYNKKL